MKKEFKKLMSGSFQESFCFAGYRVLALIFIISLLPWRFSFSQGTEAMIRTAIQEDRVYVYHTLQMSADHGFNVYRSDSGDNFVRLNEEPILGAQNVAEFMGEIGEYGESMQRALEVDNPQSLYLRLRSSRMAANLATFYYPDVARALGHLYIDETANIGSRMTYRIELVDSDGSPTGDVLEKEVSLRRIAPPQPVGLEAEHERRQVTLTWQYPTSTLQNDDKIVRFNVYSRQGDSWEKLNENPIVRINNFNEFEHIFTVPKMGVTINLVVMPVNLTMQEGPGSEVFEYTVADEEPPSIITGLQAVTNNNGEVELTWPVSTEADAAGYNLFRANRIKGNYDKLNEEPISLLETFYVDRPDELRSTYFYRISAVDNSGNESERSNASKADLPDYSPPSAPVSFSAEAQEDGTVKLNWKSPEPEADFKSYILLRKQIGRFAGKADAQLNDDDLTTTSFIDRGEADIDLADGARYQYQVFAMDSARNFSDTLTTIVKIPDNTPPEAPTRLIAENDNGIRAVLRWNASRSTDVGQYRVYKGVGEDSLTLYQSLPVNIRLFRDDSVEAGISYYYAVGAVDTLGNEGGTTEPESFLMRDFTPPRAVRNVRATLQNNEVNITWEPVVNQDLKGYRLYSSSSPTGVYELITDDLVQETEFTTDDLERSEWIQVRAIDTSGNESKASKPASIYVDDNGEDD